MLSTSILAVSATSVSDSDEEILFETMAVKSKLRYNDWKILNNDDVF